MNITKISIVIPAYNVVNEIQRCVNSVLLQTYSNIEVIIVDDGSNDGTSEYIDYLAKTDHRIRAIHKENGGVTKARLVGVAAASGEWIGFVDGDDLIEPDMYQRLINNARKYGAQIAHCGYQMVFPSRTDYYYNTGRLLEQDRITGLKDLLSGSFVEPGVCNKLYHKTLFRRLLYDNAMDFSIKNMEDLLMNYYLFLESDKSIYEDFCPYHYIVRASSAANKPLNEHQLLDPLRVTERLLEETSEEPELHIIMERRFIRNLVRLSSMDVSVNRELMNPIQKTSRRRLRKIIGNIIFRKQLGWKLKFMAFWTAVWPFSYRVIHMAYEKLTGLDKIYEIS